MPWRPVDWIMILLTGAITIVVLVNGVARYFTGEEFNPERAKALAGVLEKVMVIIAMYIGLKLRDRDKDDD